MPKRKSIEPPSKRRAIKRRRLSSARKALRGKRRLSRVSRPRFVMYDRLFQPKVLTKLTYCDTVSVSPSTSSDRNVFRLNSIYDPDFTGSGHQPAFHDRWALLYQQYRVISAAYSVTFTPYRSDHNATYVGSIDTYPYTDSSAIDQRRLPAILFTEIADQSSAIQTQSVDHNVLRETKTDAVKYRISGPTPRSYTIRGSTGLKKYHNDPDDHNKSTAFGSNPGKPIFLHAGVMNKLTGPGSTVGNYLIDVKIVYTVELTDPLDAENEN